MTQAILSKQEIEQLDDQGIAAWHNHNPEAFVGLLASSFTLYDWSLPQPIKDKSAAKEYVQAWLTAFPDMKVVRKFRMTGDDFVFGEIEFSGTNNGPLGMGDKMLPASGKHVTGKGCYLAKVQDGKVVE